jgi:predicted secreted Zn-dependent protease
VRHLLVPVALLLLAGAAVLAVVQRRGPLPARATSAPASTVSVASGGSPDAGLSDDDVFARSMARLADAKRLAESESAGSPATPAAPADATAPGPGGPALVVASAKGIAPVQACADATVPADVEIEYYEIRGASSTELRAQMNALGPSDRFGVRRFATTHWDVQWRYPFQTTPVGCALGAPKVTLKAKYILPRWMDADSAPPEVQQQWRCYLAALLVHEDGHRLHGREAAARIEALLPTLAPQPTCPEMDALANAEAHRLLEHFRDLDQEYDRNTRHGVTQATELGDSTARQGVCR